jgi:hypothetical protein
MKHLKKFNESVNKEELQDFCDTYLAYLLDDGFEVSVEHRYNNDKKYKIYDYHFITIKKLGKISNNFKWEEIKDQFIPFISVLSKEYKLGPITFNGIKYYTYRDPFTQLGMDDRKYGKEPVSKLYYTKNIINDYINFKFPIEFITIVVQ